MQKQHPVNSPSNKFEMKRETIISTLNPFLYKWQTKNIDI